jgi:hypothetical protein
VDKLSLLIILLTLLSCRFWAQTNQTTESPKQVVERYLRMVAEGYLLSSEGWNPLHTLFSRPSPEPKDTRIFVTSIHHGVGAMWVKDDRAEVHDAWWDELGQSIPTCITRLRRIRKLLETSASID